MTEKHNESRATQAFIWTNFLRAPFWAVYGLLMFIMKKDLGATYYQITCLIALKPIVGLLAPYWSALVHKRPDRLRSNLVLANIVAHLPFFFFPIFDHPWFIVFAGSLFLLMKRGIIPAWMEVLKRNLPKGKREKTFSYGSMISYLGGALLPIAFGFMMDKDPGCWRILFPLTSLLSVGGTFFLLRLPSEKTEPVEKSNAFDFKKAIVRPWMTTFDLLRKRSDFFRYQLGFMLGGGGLLLMQPALPAYFVDELHLSYRELAIAIATCKGLGFAMTSRVWAGFMNRIGIYQFSGLVTVFGALFPLALFVGKLGVSWVYAAYFVYGIMQAGSELTWHLSGPIFSKNEDSSVYSSANVIMVGLRGIVAPYIGSTICTLMGGPIVGMLTGCIFCVLATIQLFASETAVARQKAAT